MVHFRSGPSEIDAFLEANHPGILQARLIAQRLDRVVQEMGRGISDSLYRRTRDAVLRGNEQFITAERDNERLLRALWEQGPLLTPSRPPMPDIGLPRDPRQLRELWSGLSGPDREELFRRDPFLGNRNGIPHADRDFYNRRNLIDLKARAGNLAEDENFAEVMKLLRGSDGEEPRFYLSYLDGNGRIAISLDDPDLADNTVVLLQPAGRGLNQLPYAVPTARQLRDLAVLAAPRRRTAVTYWGDYDQPQSMTQAMFPAFAQDGAARAREYHEGLRATHERGGAYTTTIGHSYASVLAGHTAGHGATLDTDSVLFLGSWGTGVNHVGDLRLTGVAPERTAERVFATITDSDFVQLMPGTHGPQPTGSDFGATALESTSVLPGQFNHWDHMAEVYLRSENPASGNIGHIITGRGDLVS